MLLTPYQLNEIIDVVIKCHNQNKSRLSYARVPFNEKDITVILDMLVEKIPTLEDIKVINIEEKVSILQIERVIVD